MMCNDTSSIDEFLNIYACSFLLYNFSMTFRLKFCFKLKIINVLLRMPNSIKIKYCGND